MMECIKTHFGMPLAKLIWKDPNPALSARAVFPQSGHICLGKL